MSGLDYQKWLVEGMLSVIPKVLEVVSEQGIPKGHALYVSFKTDHPEVEISDALKERYPQKMTIVLEHQFWDLELAESDFSVVLAFGGVRERLLVPWLAVCGFADPTAQFGFETTDEGSLQLQGAETDSSSTDNDQEEGSEENGGSPAAAPSTSEPASRFEAKVEKIDAPSQGSDPGKVEPPAGKVVPFARPGQEQPQQEDLDG